MELSKHLWVKNSMQPLEFSNLNHGVTAMSLVWTQLSVVQYLNSSVL